jgi:hypothetical protein
MRIGISKEIGAEPADKIGIPVAIDIKQSATVAPVDMRRIDTLNKRSRPLAVCQRSVRDKLIGVTV